LLLDDTRLVKCFRRTDCASTSLISNQSMTVPYCCGTKAGVATSSADGTCRLCTENDADLATVSSQVQRVVNFATCVLWGRDHVRTFDGLLYDFLGV